MGRGVSALQVLVYGVSSQRGRGGDNIYGAKREDLHCPSGLLVAASVERCQGAGRVRKTRSSVSCQPLLFTKISSARCSDAARRPGSGDVSLFGV
jgi:hypothetical protein